MVSITPTITTPVTLAQYASTLDESSPTRTFVENMVRESDVLAAVPFLPAQNGKRAFMDISSLPTTGFRGLNEAGNQGTGTFNLREEDTFFIDEYILVDRAMIDRLGPEHKYKQERLKSISLGQLFTTQFMKGDHSLNPRTPTGLQARCNNPQYNLFYNSVASGGAALSMVNLDILYWNTNKPTHWIFPRGLMPYVDAAARNSSLVNQTIAFDKDDYGRAIMKYRGLPILFGYEPDDTPDMLPFTEVGQGGGAAVTSSIYCVSFRDGGLYAIEQTPMSVIPEGPVVGAPFDSTHIKWDWGIAREHPRAVSRLSSITQAALVA
jgi:hypothetical protein